MVAAPDFNAFLAGAEPNEAEIRVIEGCQSGERSDLRDLVDDERRISAALVAAIATNDFAHAKWPNWTLHPVGPRIFGATIVDELDLQFRRLPTGLRFFDCSFSAVRVSDATINGPLWLRNCKIVGLFDVSDTTIAGSFDSASTEFRNEGATAIFAQGVKAVDWFMERAKVFGHFDINSTELTGHFVANQARFNNPLGDALFAPGVKAVGWLMNEAKVFGRFDVSSAELVGVFTVNQARFENPKGVAVRAQRVKAAGWFMKNTEVFGSFDINSAELAGQFVANQARFDNPTEYAVNAQGIKATDWFMDEAKVFGRFIVSSAELTGQFAAESTAFHNGEMRAISGDFARIDGGVFLRRGTTITGGLGLDAATIGKVFDISGTIFLARDRPALSLERATLDADVLLGGARITGCVEASRAHFKSTLDLRLAQLIHGSTGLSRWRHHAVILREARIDGRLIMPERIPDGIMDLSHAQCGIYEDFASGWPKPLPKGQEVCTDRLHVDHEGGKKDTQHLVLDGFRYDHFEHPDGREGQESDAGAARKRWLASQPAVDLAHRFNPQPWRRATAVLRDMGYDEAAKVVAIERRDRERLAKNAPRTQRWINAFLRIVADYGYNPKKTVYWCLSVIAACAGVIWLATLGCGDPYSRAGGTCNEQPVFVATQWGDFDPDTVVDGYPRFDPLLYSLGAFVPLFDLGSEGYWHANASASFPVWFGALAPAASGSGAPSLEKPPRLDVSVGGALYWLFVLERIAGAILIAIAITGFTGFLTRDER